MKQSFSFLPKVVTDLIDEILDKCRNFNSIQAHYIMIIRMMICPITANNVFGTTNIAISHWSTSTISFNQLEIFIEMIFARPSFFHLIYMIPLISYINIEKKMNWNITKQ